MKFFENIVDSVAGNNVLRAHALSKDYFEFGTNGIWEVHAATARSSNKNLSVFVLHKRKLAHLEAAKKTRLIEMFANGVRAMEATKHENILQIAAPLSESKECYAFATEPVAHAVNVNKVETAQIIFNQFQIIETLVYIQKSFGMSLGYFSTNNIIVTTSGEWKLCCFDFMSQSDAKNQKLAEFYDLGQNINQFCAPEIHGDLFTNFWTDMFNVFVVFLLIYNKNNSEFTSLYSSRSNHDLLLKRLKSPNDRFYSNVPPNLRNLYVSLMYNTCDKNTFVQTFLKALAVESKEIILYKNLKNYANMTSFERTEFMNIFDYIVPKLKDNFVLHRVINYYVNDLADETKLIPLLKIILKMLPLLDKQTAQDFFPKISHVFDSNNIDAKLVLMENIYTFFDIVPASHQNKIVGLIKYSINSPYESAQLLALESIHKNILQSIIFAEISSIYPHIKQTLKTSSSINVQVNCLIVISDFLKVSRSKVECDDMIMTLCSFSSLDPAVLLSIVGCFQNSKKNYNYELDLELISFKIIPKILECTQNPSMNKNQLSICFKICELFFNHLKEKMLPSSDNKPSLPQNNHIIDSKQRDEKVMNDFNFLNSLVGNNTKQLSSSNFSFHPSNPIMTNTVPNYSITNTTTNPMELTKTNQDFYSHGSIFPNSAQNNISSMPTQNQNVNPNQWNSFYSSDSVFKNTSQQHFNNGQSSINKNSQPSLFPDWLSNP